MHNKIRACMDFCVSSGRCVVHRGEGDSPIFADHGFAAVPAKIGTVPKITLVCLLAAILFLPTTARSQDAIRWEPTLESAQRVAGQTNRLVLIQFWAPWCTVCKRMEADVLRQPNVVGVVSANYVAVKVNADHFPSTAQQYGVTALPTTVITTPQGKPLETIKGWVDVAQLSARLTQVATAKQSAVAAYAQIPSMAPPTSVTSSPTQPTASQPIVGAQNLPPVAGTQSSGAAGPSPAMGAPGNNAMADSRYADYFRRPTEPITPIAQPQSSIPPSVNSRPVNYPTSGPVAGNATVPSLTAPQIVQPAAMPTTVASGPQSPPSWPQQPNMSSTLPNSTVPSGPARNVAAPLPVLNPPLGLDGFCPVALAEKQQWMAGDRRWGAIHRGRTYLFSSPDAQRSFFKDPDRYAPVVSGNDVVLAAEQGQVVPGMREHGVFFGPRIYLFSSEATLEKFSRNPNLYANQTLGSLRTGAYAGQPLQ